mmetsp:Transcript_9518/g.15582  ORF Transcript_9518/g.15582 Transcript_9518/m.15582 type:complete len:287 (+) Transcript_9518:501-1361(+)
MLLDHGWLGETLLGVADEELLEQVLGLVADGLGDLETSGHDLLVHLLHVLRVEGGQTSEHLKHQGSKAPPVDGLSVSVSFKDLRSKVLGRSAEGGSAIVVADETFLGDTKVGHADVAIVREEQVLRLQITIEDTAVVEVLETKDDFGTVEASTLLAETLVALEVVEKLTTVDVVHDEEELVGGLERVVEVDEEGVAELLQNALLGARVLEFVSLDNRLLVEDLHGVDLSCVLLLHLHHLSEASLSNHAQGLKVIDSDLLCVRIGTRTGCNRGRGGSTIGTRGTIGG